METNKQVVVDILKFSVSQGHSITVHHQCGSVIQYLDRQTLTLWLVHQDLHLRNAAFPLGLSLMKISSTLVVDQEMLFNFLTLRVPAGVWLQLSVPFTHCSKCCTMLFSPPQRTQYHNTVVILKNRPRRCDVCLFCVRLPVHACTCWKEVRVCEGVWLQLKHETEELHGSPH